MSSVSIVVRLAKVVEIVLDRLDLTVNQYRMLTFVDGGAPPVRDMSVRLVMKEPNVSTLIDGLVGRGLITRERRRDDRRRLELSLTKRGRTVLDDADRQCDAALQRVASAGARKPTKLLRGLDDWLPGLDAVASELTDSLSHD